MGRLFRAQVLQKTPTREARPCQKSVGKSGFHFCLRSCTQKEGASLTRPRARALRRYTFSPRDSHIRPSGKTGVAREAHHTVTGRASDVHLAFVDSQRDFCKQSLKGLKHFASKGYATIASIPIFLHRSHGSHPSFQRINILDSRDHCSGSSRVSVCTSSCPNSISIWCS